MSSKNVNFLKFWRFLAFFFRRSILKIFVIKINNFEQKLTYFEIKINGAKHSPPPSTLGRPSAGFGGPRAGACFWHFEPIFFDR